LQLQARKAAQREGAQPTAAKRTHTSEQQQQQQQQQYDTALCCMLCRRAFKSAEALQTHIAQSELHLINEQLLGFGLDAEPQLKRAKLTEPAATAAAVSDGDSNGAAASITTAGTTTSAGVSAVSMADVINDSSSVK
jgi:hypothetical protein